MNKRKLLTLTLSASVLAILAIGGTLAYFTDTDSATNVFTIGNVSIVQNEQQRSSTATSTGLEDFQPDKSMLPVAKPHNQYKTEDLEVVYTSTGLTGEGQRKSWGNRVYPVEDGFVDKIVSVTNTGTVPCYFRTLFAFEMGKQADGSFTDVIINSDKMGYNRSKAFTKLNEFIEKDGVKYQLAVSYTPYTQSGDSILLPGETSCPSLLQVFVTATTGNEIIDLIGDKYEILVITQAIQQAGFTDAKTALDEGFGEVNSTNAAEWFANL